MGVGERKENRRKINNRFCLNQPAHVYPLFHFLTLSITGLVHTQDTQSSNMKSVSYLHIPSCFALPRCDFYNSLLGTRSSKPFFKNKKHLEETMLAKWNCSIQGRSPVSHTGVPPSNLGYSAYDAASCSNASGR